MDCSIDKCAACGEVGDETVAISKSKLIDILKTLEGLKRKIQLFIK